MWEHIKAIARCPWYEWARRGQKGRSGSSPKLRRRRRRHHYHGWGVMNWPWSHGSKAWSSRSQRPTTTCKAQEDATRRVATPPRLLGSTSYTNQVNRGHQWNWKCQHVQKVPSLRIAQETISEYIIFHQRLCYQLSQMEIIIIEQNIY
jgi:hypothetical protein